MRSLPMALAREALAHGLEVHNYYTQAFYAEVFIPEQVAGCMLWGTIKEIKAFLLLFESDKLDLADREALVADMEVHQLGMQRRNALAAVCFPDWQFEPEGDA